MEHDLTHLIQRLVFELALILVAAKLGGELFQRYLKLPAVLGELLAGVAIGPHALGGVTFLSDLGPLFEKATAASEVVPVSVELYGIAQVASVVLLFVVGLETNLKQFIKYSAPASLVALGGVVLPFALGIYSTVFMGFADSIKDPEALFVGAIMTATSVGITARVLSDKKQLDTPEGVTILGAAVVDDVLGILILTVVVGIAATGTISLGEVLEVGGKAFGFWLGLTIGGILLSKYISGVFMWFKGGGALIGLALALALFSSGLAETFGLALIIGAYSIGLALSPTPLAKNLEHSLRSVYDFTVPIFFVVMGMLVDVGEMRSAIGFGAVLTALAVVSKVVGSGGAALGAGFNLRGAARIGVGMMPRGEVALVVAGVGLTRGVIENDIFGVAIMMTLVTTIVAPPLLGPLFEKGGSGLRSRKKEGESDAI